MINGILIPLPTTIPEAIIFAMKRGYGEISYLSSIMPTTRAIKDATKSAITIFVKGKKNIPVSKMPIKRGIPPPLGMGFEWITPGCLWRFGSSRSPSLLIKLIDIKVNIVVERKENINASIKTILKN